MGSGHSGSSHSEESRKRTLQGANPPLPLFPGALAPGRRAQKGRERRRLATGHTASEREGGSSREAVLMEEQSQRPPPVGILSWGVDTKTLNF